MIYPISSCMLSNDSQMRCNFVDFYYALYGSKRPNCLIGSESSSLSHFPKIPKLSAAEVKRRSESPVTFKTENEDDVKIPQDQVKIEEELVIDNDNLDIKPDVVDLVQVHYKHNTIFSSVGQSTNASVFFYFRKI